MKFTENVLVQDTNLSSDFRARALKISENPKKKKQIQHSDEGKQSKKKSNHQQLHFWIHEKCGPAITVYRH